MSLRPRLARMIAAAKDPPPPPPLDLAEVVVPQVSPILADENARNKRAEAALSMADDDVYGYVLVMLRKPEGASRPEVTVTCSVHDDSWWPPLVETFRRIGRAALR